MAGHMAAVSLLFFVWMRLYSTLVALFEIKIWSSWYISPRLLNVHEDVALLYAPPHMSDLRSNSILVISSACRASQTCRAPLLKLSAGKYHSAISGLLLIPYVSFGLVHSAKLCVFKTRKIDPAARIALNVLLFDKLFRLTLTLKTR